MTARTATRPTHRAAAHRRQPAEPGERGSASAELVLMMPVLILLLYFVVYCERGAEARMRLDDAAHQAACAASQARTPGQATEYATASATAALEDAGIACQRFDVDIRGSLRAASTVTATLTCTVGLDDLAMLPLPGTTTTLTADFAAPVDAYRSTTAPPLAQAPQEDGGEDT